MTEQLWTEILWTSFCRFSRKVQIHKSQEVSLQLLLHVNHIATSNMTGRTGYRTMEMNGGSSASYLARTPCVPLFVHCLIGVETEGLLDYQGKPGIISVVRRSLRPVMFGLLDALIVGDFKSNPLAIRNRSDFESLQFQLRFLPEFPQI